jgi:high-affinity iron transporter
LNLNTSAAEVWVLDGVRTTMHRLSIATGLVALITAPVGGMEVSGRVEMPEFCSPAVSPAVAILERRDGPTVGPLLGGRVAEVAVINQRGLQFVPRIQAITLGQTLRFTNEDAETHNVHIGSRADPWNQAMAPGQVLDFTPTWPGELRLMCDVHSHMRGYVIVSRSPWIRVCTREGRFRFEGVPAGRYVLRIWHEVGRPLRKDCVIDPGASGAVDLGSLSLDAPAPAPGAVEAVPIRPWPDVIDRIGLILGSSLDAATRPGGWRKARRLADDAYWGEFETSDMETAVRTHLGLARAGAIEDQFRAVRESVRAVAEGRQSPSKAAERARQLLVGLARASAELNRKGVTDRSRVFAASADEPRDTRPRVRLPVDHRAQLLALKRGFARVRDLADQGEADDAASAMTEVYWRDFEPLERFIAAHQPQDVRPLEVRFSAVRGAIGTGVRGEALAARLDGVQTDLEAVLRRSAAVPDGAFGPAFAASLITILREGVEVILLLTMLITLAARAGQPGALRAIGWGVALAVLASAGTAVGLSLMVASTQGRAREVVEGLVLLAAAGVLFYVSYWLIAQSESKRWMDYLRRQAQRGVELGGRATLALTAFLAVYREGAETALMYQALIDSQHQARAGLLGLGGGLGVGLVLLAGIACAIRVSSVRLPLRAFFKLTGVILFALAVIFAGNGVFELQASGVLRMTPLTWLGRGLPLLGVYPNVQALSVQGLLLAGAVLAWLLAVTGDRAAAPVPRASGPHVSVGPAPAAGGV